jgi:hypothetical protein
VGVFILSFVYLNYYMAFGNLGDILYLFTLTPHPAHALGRVSGIGTIYILTLGSHFVNFFIYFYFYFYFFLGGGGRGGIFKPFNFLVNIFLTNIVKKKFTEILTSYFELSICELGKFKNEFNRKKITIIFPSDLFSFSFWYVSLKFSFPIMMVKMTFSYCCDLSPIISITTASVSYLQAPTDQYHHLLFLYHYCF